MLKGFLLPLFILFFIFPGLSQTNQSPGVEDTLYNCFKRLRVTPDQSQKKQINDSIRDIFKRILVKKEFFENPFDTLRTVGRIMSPDEKFRIINWNTLDGDGTYTYYAFIQYYHKDKDEIVLTELIDKSDSIPDPEQQVLDAENWYGALYYDIVPPPKRKYDEYLLLGWDGGTLFLNRKVIDVLRFTSSGVPRFGKSIFKLKKDRKKRIIFEFSYMASMRLFYDDDIDMVVFEHLVPLTPAVRDQKSYYGSDLTFDGLEFEDGKWHLRENLDVKNSKKDLNKRKKDISFTF